MENCDTYSESELYDSSTADGMTAVIEAVGTAVSGSAVSTVVTDVVVL